jgi:hypothetical protein
MWNVITVSSISEHSASFATSIIREEINLFLIVFTCLILDLILVASIMFFAYVLDVLAAKFGVSARHPGRVILRLSLAYSIILYIFISLVSFYYIYKNLGL